MTTITDQESRAEKAFWNQVTNFPRKMAFTLYNMDNAFHMW